MPELFTLQIQGALSARNWFVPLGSDTEHSILTAVDHTKGLIFFPIYITGHSEAASSSLVGRLGCRTQKVALHRVDKCKKTLRFRKQSNDARYLR